MASLTPMWRAQLGTGSVTIAGGTLKLGTSAAIGDVALTMNGGTFDLNGTNPSLGALNGAAAATITSGIGGTASLTVGSAADSQFDGVIQDGSGIVSLVKQGIGTLTLFGANTFSGGTTISTEL